MYDVVDMAFYRWAHFLTGNDVSEEPADGLCVCRDVNLCMSV